MTDRAVTGGQTGPVAPGAGLGEACVKTAMLFSLPPPPTPDSEDYCFEVK